MYNQNDYSSKIKLKFEKFIVLGDLNKQSFEKWWAAERKQPMPRFEYTPATSPPSPNHWRFEDLHIKWHDLFIFIEYNRGELTGWIGTNCDDRFFFCLKYHQGKA